MKIFRRSLVFLALAALLLGAPAAPARAESPRRVYLPAVESRTFVPGCWAARPDGTGVICVGGW